METASNEMSNAFTQVCYHCEHTYEVCSVVSGLIWKPILNVYVKFINSCSSPVPVVFCLIDKCFVLFECMIHKASYLCLQGA